MAKSPKGPVLGLKTASPRDVDWPKKTPQPVDPKDRQAMRALIDQAGDDIQDVLDRLADR